jgi:hypothetical protein
MFRSPHIVTAILVSLWSFSSMAHPGHDEEEPLTEQQVAELANKSLPELVKGKQVDAVWGKAQQQKVAQAKSDGKDIWVVTYKAAKGSAAGKELLYVFFDDLGNFLSANHTGKL